jgi:exodeoxyribonuclease VII large subunit
MNKPELLLTPTDFVTIANQSLEHVFGSVHIEGELANLKISKNRWLYFDIKDEFSKVSCFGSVHILPGPLNEGMLIKIIGQPRLYPQFGFNINVQSIQPSGEGSIKKAYDLLKAKLKKEGLFDENRKRLLPYPPNSIALITSLESAAYADFVKILNVRWPFLRVKIFDVQVQGESAPVQIINALENANKSLESADVAVLIRGGGSGDDLSAFDDERVVRALASSRMPTLVAIGHEIDTSLSELVADKRASTPSNAAELLVPDKAAEKEHLRQQTIVLKQNLQSIVVSERNHLANIRSQIIDSMQKSFLRATNYLESSKQLLIAYNPDMILKRGYSIVRSSNNVIKDISQIMINQTVNVQIYNGNFEAIISKINKQ